MDRQPPGPHHFAANPSNVGNSANPSSDPHNSDPPFPAETPDINSQQQQNHHYSLAQTLANYEPNPYGAHQQQQQQQYQQQHQSHHHQPHHARQTQAQTHHPPNQREPYQQQQPRHQQHHPYQPQQNQSQNPSQHHQLSSQQPFPLPFLPTSTDPLGASYSGSSEPNAWQPSHSGPTNINSPLRGYAPSAVAAAQYDPYARSQQSGAGLPMLTSARQQQHHHQHQQPEHIFSSGVPDIPSLPAQAAARRGRPSPPKPRHSRLDSDNGSSLQAGPGPLAALTHPAHTSLVGSEAASKRVVRRSNLPGAVAVGRIGGTGGPKLPPSGSGLNTGSDVVRPRAARRSRSKAAGSVPPIPIHMRNPKKGRARVFRNCPSCNFDNHIRRAKCEKCQKPLPAGKRRKETKASDESAVDGPAQVSERLQQHDPTPGSTVLPSDVPSTLGAAHMRSSSTNDHTGQTEDNHGRGNHMVPLPDSGGFHLGPPPHSPGRG